MPEPAGELRAAAQRLRTLADAVASSHPVPWRLGWHGQQLYLLDASEPGPGPYPGPSPECVTEWTYGVRTWEPEASADRAECVTALPDYLTAMHPGVALALADWLDDIAGSHTHVGDREVSAWDLPGTSSHPALVLARLVLEAR